MSEKILVTGANGFVGKAVCRRLLQSGYPPRAGLRSGALWTDIHNAVPGLSEFAVIGDLDECSRFKSTLENVGVVVHLAARVHIMNDNGGDSAAEYRRVNVGGTESLARAAVEHGVRRFVFLSSVKVNGESTLARGFTEGDPPEAKDPYGISKWHAEEALRSVALKHGIEVVIVRSPLVYGPGVRANFFRLMTFVAKGIPLPLPDTDNLRSLVGVENLADVLTICTQHPRAANQTFLVSDGEDISTRELVVRLANALGRSPRFLPISERLLRFAARLIGKEDLMNRLLGSLVVNSDKIRGALTWTPPVTLDVGIERTVSWYLRSSKRSE